MAKRSGKFYYRNEKEVMEMLGLKQTKGSGNGWVEKEDGQNDKVICQLKSTDANSIRVIKKDIDTLLYNAEVARKYPVFAIQFLQSNEVYLLVKPEELVDVAKYIKTGKGKETKNEFLGVETCSTPILDRNERMNNPTVMTIKSSKSAREEYANEQSRKFKNIRRAY